MQFNTYNDIENVSLRTYNRAVQVINIADSFNEGKAEDYLKQFSDGEKKGVYAILIGIKKYGADAVKKAIMHRMEEGV